MDRRARLRRVRLVLPVILTVFVSAELLVNGVRMASGQFEDTAVGVVVVVVLAAVDYVAVSWIVRTYRAIARADRR